MLSAEAPNGFLEHQDIYIEGNRIAAIRRSGEPLSGVIEVDGAIQIDGAGCLAIPGLVNAHTHSPENALRGSSEHLPLELWLVSVFTFLPDFPPRLLYLLVLAGAAEMLRSGVTATLDHFAMPQPLSRDGLESAMQAYATSGMRVGFAPMLEDQDRVLEGVLRALPDESILRQFRKSTWSAGRLLQAAEDFIARWHGGENGRLRGLPGPGGLQWCSTELLEGSRDIASRYHTGLHMHLNETRFQSEFCRVEYGHSAVRELDRLGILRPGTSLAHCVWLEEDDLEIIQRSGAVVVHNPVSNLRLGSGLAPVPEMLRRGIPVALGTDGPASNDNQNMFSVMKLAGLLHSPAFRKDGAIRLDGTFRQDGAWIRARDVLRMATLSGAKVLGYGDELGSLQEGCLADIAFLDLREVIRSLNQDAYLYLVYDETGSSIRHVMVDGRWVLRDRQATSFPEGEIREELRQTLQYFQVNTPPIGELLNDLLAEWRAGLAGILRAEGNEHG